MDFWLLATALNFIAGFIKIGECTLTCLKGDNLPMARDSNTVQQCGSHEFCSLEQFITPNGFIRHKASCKDSQVCGGSTVPGTYMVVCSECCDTDLCSASGCNSNGYNRTRGHICYHCDYPVDDPKQCDKIRICSYDQVCGMHQTPYGQYNMGCESKATCAAIKSLGVCSTCCSTDLCNRQCTVQAGTTKPPVSCQDSKDCKTISTAVAAQGLDVCQNQNLKHFCNYTCGLCPGQTTNGQLSTGTSNSATSSTATTRATAQTTAPNYCNPSPCIHGSCIPTSTNYVCACSPGYTGSTCDKIDQCHSKPCVHGTCVAIPGSFHCTCHNNFTGRLCDSAIVVNPCSPNPCVHGTCTPSGQAFTCSCNSGYSGPTCAVQDPCSPNPCTHGQCSKTGSTFSCSCNSGYTGTTCSQVQSPCSPNPCVHGMCTAPGSSFSCKCNSGYIGTTCNIQDPCSAVPCIHGNCSSTSSGGYHCHCTPGYTGVACDTDIDECKSNPCLNGVCQDKVNGYTCSCYAGYTGQQCKTDIDECQSIPCANNGLCYNEINGYTCRCFPGYTGKQCSTVIDNCAPRNPCRHHGTCHNQVNGFSCTCAAGYSGTTCNHQAKLRDCKDVLDFGLGSQDGIQSIDLGSSKTSVYCDMTTDGGGWTVLLYRKDSQVDFLHHDSNDYALGFGSKHSDFWQGLEDMHALTSDGRRYQLRVDMTAANGTDYYEIYDDFYIGPASDFTLHIGSHRGTAGDSLSGHNGFGFTTSDHDVDSNPGINCAKYLGGSWWFHDCYDSCLTCEYVIAKPGTQECASMSWGAVRYCEPLRLAKMMIRPM